VTHRFLVTGAAGFIGSHLSEALMRRGHDVTGVDNFDPFYARDVKERNLSGLRTLPGFRFVEADVARDPLPLDGVEAVIHLAAKPGVRPSLEDPGAYMEANVTATARLLDAVRRAGLTRIVFGSSSSVYGNATPAPFAEDQPAVLPISPYAASKRAGELLAHAFAHLYPLKIICLRFFTVYGPRQRPDLAIHKFTDLIARGCPVRMHGDGSSERDYTYITDCLDGILAALDWTAAAAPGTVETVNLGGGERVRLDRLIALIATALGQDARIEHHPDQPGDVRLTSKSSARVSRVADVEMAVDRVVGIESHAKNPTALSIWGDQGGDIEKRCRIHRSRGKVDDLDQPMLLRHKNPAGIPGRRTDVERHVETCGHSHRFDGRVAGGRASMRGWRRCAQSSGIPTSARRSRRRRSTWHSGRPARTSSGSSA